jgi:hypothetical protein
MAVPQAPMKSRIKALPGAAWRAGRYQRHDTRSVVSTGQTLQAARIVSQSWQFPRRLIECSRLSCFRKAAQSMLVNREP